MLADVGFTLTGRWGDVFGADVVFGLIFLLPATIGLTLFIDPADRMAQSVDLALTTELAGRLNRFLRLRMGIRVFLLFLIAQLFFATALATNEHTGHVIELIMLPGGVWISAVAASLLPRWKTTGPIHLAHLRRLTVKDTLSRVELTAVVASYPAGALLAGWTIWAAGAPWRMWCWLPAVFLAAQAGVTFWIGKYVMNTRAAGRDVLELAWDDVLRFGRVRSLFATTSFATLLFIAGSALDTAHIEPLTPILPILFVVPCCALGTAWRKSSACGNWRRAWPATQTGPAPSLG